MKSIPNLRAVLRCVAYGVTCASVTTAWSAVTQQPEKSGWTVPVANFTGFTDAELSKHLTENLKPDLKEAIRNKGLVVVLTAWKFDMKNSTACVATSGVSLSPPKGRNPRWPDKQMFHYTVESSEDCLAATLREAIQALNNQSLDSTLAGIERTADGKAARVKLPADNSRVSLHRSFSAGYDTDPLFDKLHAFRVGEAVDYRHVLTYVGSSSSRFADGSLACFALSGFSARAPEGLSTRVPASMNAYIDLRDKGDLADCEQAAALGAVGQLMEDPWVGKQGRFAGFERASENDIPRPDLNRIAAVERRLLEASRRASQPSTVRSRQVNRLHCTNTCYNGDCLRTFADGRQERWQAPRVYDPMSRDWKWDTSSCGG